MIQVIPKNFFQKVRNDFGIEELSVIQPVSTSGNIAYLFKGKQKKYLLRLSPLGPRWRSKEEILAEIELLDYLRGRNFPVSAPLLSKNGKQVISWKKHHGYIREYIKGHEKNNPSLKEIEIFGSLLGTYHNLIENYKTRYKRNHVWNLEETTRHFRENKSFIAKKDIDGQVFFDQIDHELEKLHFPSTLPMGTIHEDLGKRHVLWNMNNIVSIIDFDRCYYGYLIFDLAQAMRGWCFSSNWKTWSDRKFNALLCGYKTKRSLNQLEKKYLLPAIQFAILERAISFYLRSLLVTSDEKENREYAFYSISPNGLLGIIGKRSSEIRKILKI